MQGSGGLGAVSSGISETLIETLVGLVVLAVVVFGIWKLAKMLWAAFAG